MSRDFKLFIGSLTGLIVLLLFVSYLQEHNDRVRISPTKAITNNLRHIASSGQQYIVEGHATTVSYQQLLGEYLSPLQSIEDETYEHLVVTKDGGVLKAKTSSGLEVAFTY